MKKIFISAGHSFADPGAKSPDGKITEAGIVTDLRDVIAQILIQKGLLPGKDFETDGGIGQNLPLKTAIARAKKCSGPRIELHCNSAENPKATGVESLSLPAQKDLAKRLSQAIAGVLGLRTRGEQGWKPQEQSQHHRLGFVQLAQGVICELFFICNAEDLKAYLPNQKKIAESIADLLIEDAKK